jgi:hypothetical protein
LGRYQEKLFLFSTFFLLRRLLQDKEEEQSIRVNMVAIERYQAEPSCSSSSSHHPESPTYKPSTRFPFYLIFQGKKKEKKNRTRDKKKKEKITGPLQVRRRQYEWINVV